MNKEILMAVDAVSNEKGVDKEIIFEALEAALASATRKKHGEELDVRVSINRKTGGYDTFRRWKVFADDSTELEVPERELRMDDARDIDKDVEPGGYVEEPMESVPFGRILAQTAKQVIVQKVREAERAQVVDAYKDRAGTLVSGIVKRVDRNGVYVDLGANAEGFIAREEMIPREPVRSQDRIKAYLKEVRTEPRGPQLFRLLYQVHNLNAGIDATAIDENIPRFGAIPLHPVGIKAKHGGTPAKFPGNFRNQTGIFNRGGV